MAVKTHSDRLRALPRLLFGLFMVWVLALCLFFYRMPHMDSRQGAPFLPSLLLLCGGLAFLGLVRAGLNRIFPDEVADTKRVAVAYGLLSLILFLAQAFLVRYYYFYTGWDSRILLEMAGFAAKKESLVSYAYYLSRYPNNMLLVWLYGRLMRPFVQLGLEEHLCYFLLVFQCALNAFTGFLLAMSLHELFGKRRQTAAGYLVYVLLIGCSPWIAIPYSDSIGLVFPMLGYYLYLRTEKSRHPACLWLVIGALAVTGYKIKPQLLFLYAAVLIGAVYRLPGSTVPRACAKIRVSSCAAALAGVLLATLGTGLAVQELDVTLDMEKEFGIAHFLMMGMNTDAMGGYCEDDVQFSAGFENSAERNAADLKLAAERIRAMGAGGFLQHMARKTLTNFNDGTFCWSGEGDFFHLVLNRDDTLSRLMRSFYYTADQAETGTNYNLWANGEQALWLALLVLSCFAACGKGSSKLSVLMLALLLLGAFELLFEARARYIYAYAPCFIPLALSGGEALCSSLRRHTK